VRALAAKLAPALVEADALLATALPSMMDLSMDRSQNDVNDGTADDDEDNDDNIEQEMRDLQFSEELLRQELALAVDFGHIVRKWTSDSLESSSWHHGDHHLTASLVTQLPYQYQLTTTTMATTNHEADVDQNQDQALPEEKLPAAPAVAASPTAAAAGVTVPDHKDEGPQPSEPLYDPVTPPRIRTSFLSPFSSAEKSFTLASTPGTVASQATSWSGFWTSTGESDSPSTSSRSLLPGTSVTPARYRHQDHVKTLRLHQEQQGWYMVDLTAFLSSRAAQCEKPIVQEYCLAVPEAKIKQMYVGLPDRMLTTTISTIPTSALPSATPETPPLPVRTLVIRIRPDVLCGAVMEALYKALSRLQKAVIQKRQGGHCQALVQSDKYWVDVLLATEKTRECARKLIVRVYHEASRQKENGNDEDDNALAMNASSLSQDSTANFMGESEEDSQSSAPLPDLPNPQPGLRLRESAALIQRMEAPRMARKMIRMSSAPLTQESMQRTISEHLLENYRACPSVREGAITLPSLNADDFDIIQKSWKLVDLLWEESDTRDLAYSTLQEARFGAFPALPTLDVHYCSQVRRISRELMVVQLLKSASDLEEYAREAEYACANMISMLKPTFEAYGVPEPNLPQPIALTNYPLHFTAPQVLCPPWGIKVQHALNEIQTWGDDIDLANAQSFQRAEQAVHLVLEAFQKQDDEEQSARLERKNLQVMDRLAAMQAHEKAMVDALSRSLETSGKAAKAANEFLVKAGVRQVPLIKWSIVATGTSGAGSCIVTSHHVMFSTQLIPVLGGTTVKIFALHDVEFSVREETPSLLNPLPTVVTVKDKSAGTEVYSFRPSMGGGARLKSFLDRLKDNSLLDGPFHVTNSTVTQS